VAVVGEEGGSHGVRCYWEEEKRISMGGRIYDIGREIVGIKEIRSVPRRARRVLPFDREDGHPGRSAPVNLEVFLYRTE
jgi:hypothetical protein